MTPAGAGWRRVGISVVGEPTLSGFYAIAINHSPAGDG